MITKNPCVKYARTLLFILGFAFASCTKEEVDLIGKWDDIIKLSAHNALLSSEEDSAIFTTQGTWWWIDHISFNDSTYTFYNNPNINLESASYLITTDQFTIERKEATTLIVKLSPNHLPQKRTMKIALQAGNYFDNITIVQQEKDD